MAKSLDVTLYLDYLKLDKSGMDLFQSSNLDHILKSPFKVLESRIGTIADYSALTNEKILKLNSLVGEMLTLIGKFSNARFGANPVLQNSFFCKPNERETFPSHLLTSKWLSRESQIRNKEGNKSKFHTPPGELFSKDAFKPTVYSNKITFCSSKLTDTEMRAIGLLYMTNLVWLNLNEICKAQNTKMVPGLIKLTVAMSGILDESPVLISRSIGGKKKALPNEIDLIFEKIEKKYQSLSRPQKIAKAKIELRNKDLKIPSDRTLSRKFTSNKR
ncbi:MAG: hypothetical protein V4654_08845 [Bdellovibrionota bacterium]